MTSTAISAQGSSLSIGTGSGGAKSITGVAVGNPTILTSAGHALNNGDVVALASLTGADAALLNGKSPSIRAITTNTFAVDIDTTGKTITAGSGTATPVTWTAIGNVKSFSGFDGQASEVDRTNFASAAKEYILGLVDFGGFSFDCDYDYADAGQAAVLAKQGSGILTNFKLTLPDSHTASFTAYVKKLPTSGGVDQVVKRAGATLRISGAVTWA
jgi:hypothetical protein